MQASSLLSHSDQVLSLETELACPPLLGLSVVLTNDLYRAPTSKWMDSYLLDSGKTGKAGPAAAFALSPSDGRKLAQAWGTPSPRIVPGLIKGALTSGANEKDLRLPST